MIKTLQYLLDIGEFTSQEIDELINQGEIKETNTNNIKYLKLN